MNLVEQLKSVLPQTLVENLPKGNTKDSMNEASEESQKLATMLKPYKDPNVLGDGIGLHLADIYLDKNKMQQFTNMIHALVFTASQNLDSSKKKLLAREFKDVTWLLESKKLKKSKRKFLLEWDGEDDSDYYDRDEEDPDYEGMDVDDLEDEALGNLRTDYPLVYATGVFLNFEDANAMLGAIMPSNYTKDWSTGYQKFLTAFNSSAYPDAKKEKEYLDSMYKDAKNNLPMHDAGVSTFGALVAQINILVAFIKDKQPSMSLKEALGMRFFNSIIKNLSDLMIDYNTTNNPKSNIYSSLDLSDIKTSSGVSLPVEVEKQIKKFSKGYTFDKFSKFLKVASIKLKNPNSLTVQDVLDIFNSDMLNIDLIKMSTTEADTLAYQINKKDLIEIKGTALTNPFTNTISKGADFLLMELYEDILG